MKLLAPSMLYLASALPIVVLFYMLRMRRKNTPISSTYLWQDLLQDIQANTPWQRLRVSLLMLLQLLILILLILALAAPAMSRTAGKAENIVLIIDISQSMGSKEGGGSRLEMAKAKANEIVRQAPSTARISLITAADSARVVAINSRDKGRIRNEIESLKTEGSSTDLSNALHLGTSIAHQLKSSETYLFSDGGFKSIDTDLQAPVRFMRIGQSDTNVAVRTALLVDSANPPHDPELFVSVKNFSGARQDAIISVYSKGTLIDSKRLSLDPHATESAVFLDGVAGLKEAEVKLTCDDALNIDNTAKVTAPNRSLGRIALVSNGNAFLEQGLRSVSSAKLTLVSPQEWEKAEGVAKEADITVLDSFVPDVLPGRNLIIVNPPLAKGSPQSFEASGKKKVAAIETLDPNHPVLRFCDVSEVKVASIKTAVLPEWMRTIAAGKLANGSVDTGAAVIAAGERAGSRVVVLSFDLRDSDLPLRVTFPILLSNIVDYLDPSSANKDKGRPDEGTQLAQKNDANLESDIAPADHPELEHAATQKGKRDARAVDVELWPWIAAAVLLLLLAEGWAYVRGY